MSGTAEHAYDLTDCDREPIHKLGKIQSFGCLLALTGDWNVAFKSANTRDILRLRDDIEVGSRLMDHLCSDAMGRIREASSGREGGAVERIFGLSLSGSDRLFDVAVHRSAQFIIVEAEPSETQGIDTATGKLRPLMQRLQAHTGVTELCDAAATELKQLLGIDRVMVYRFHPDESGEVLAEAAEPHLESFLSLRYPKSDIPKQARELYVRNLFRIISDVNEAPVPILGAGSASSESLDLSYSTLRAVSPIHIEYLRNMGVGASLSISIVVNGKLWGLFACHHYSAKVVPYTLRTLSELFAQLFALQLEIAISNAGNLLKERAQMLHDRMISQLPNNGSIADNLPLLQKEISGIIAQDGASAFIDGIYQSRGVAPNEEQFRALLPALNSAAVSTIVETEDIRTLLPEGADKPAALAGALVIPVSRRPRDYVVLWRRELPRIVNWAGNPEKPVEYGPNGARLTPRKSFAAWQETVRGRSAPWTEEELAIAESLRVTLLEVILRIAEETMEERKRAEERQNLLIAELNHRVRNILTLIRGLISQSRAEVSDVRDFADLVGGRIRALALAHDNITREQWSPASLHELIEAEAEAYLAGKADRVLISGPDVLVTPEAYTVLALVMHEMMTNSAKYGALCDHRGKLEIDTRIDEYGDLAIQWREKNGPPVRAPKRSGFGSTIIEKSIPHELKGQATIRYELSGVEADFLIPARLVHRGKQSADAERQAARAAPPPPPSALSHTDPVLLVEDSMIIAMDTEEMLRELGYSNVMVAGSSAAALAEIAEQKPGFAILDYNLGDENSEDIAERLAADGVPFWFATGYGEAMKGNEKGALGVLQKPFSKDDLQKALGTLDE